LVTFEEEAQAEHNGWKRAEQRSAVMLMIKERH
jgi:hypothetical protein